MKCISIILPIYNMENYLRESLNSVLKQTIKDIEIICINDGSSDNSLSILKEYQKKDDRITVIDQKNAGSGAARNNGLKIANGEYIAFLDPDDYFTNNSTLEKLYNNAKANECDLAGANFNFIYNDHDYKDDAASKILDEEKNYKKTTNYFFSKDFVGKTEDYKMSSWFWRFIFKKKFLDDNNVKFPNYKRFQDIPFLAKSLSLCNKIYFSKDYYYSYRINHKVMKYSKQQKQDVISSLNDCFDIYYNNKKYIQYSDTFTIFVEMLDVFSNDFIEERNNYEDLLRFSNEIFENINFELFDFSHFPKKNVKNLKNILKLDNYAKLTNLCDKYYEEEI